MACRGSGVRIPSDPPQGREPRTSPEARGFSRFPRRSIGRPVVVREIPLHKGETLAELEARMHVVEHEIIVEATAEMVDRVSIHPLSKSQSK